MSNEFLTCYYGYLLNRNMTANTETDEKLTVLSYLNNPVTYSYLKNISIENGNYANLSLMELIFESNIGIENAFDESTNDYTEEYKRLWLGIWRMIHDPEWVISTGEEKDRQYFTNIEFGNEKGRISFVYRYKSSTGNYNDKCKYVIFTKLDDLKEGYVITNNYYVFYDDKQERNIIESDDVPSMLIELVGEIGKTNIYDGIAQYIYSGYTTELVIEDGKETYKYSEEKIEQHFYILYVKNAPSKDRMKSLIKEKLIYDYSDENGQNGERNARLKYPDLFEKEIRKIYMLKENNFYPVSYNILIAFMQDHEADDIMNPEVISMLHYDCPFVVDRGVSDIITAYHPLSYEGSGLTRAQRDANEFLYMLSSVVNYINGLLVTLPKFAEATNEYVQFDFSFITWRVMKN